MIVMPAMGVAQEAAWRALLDLFHRQPEGWALIGGQLVHLHCAERGFDPQRATEDADAVVNARVPQLLGAVTGALMDMHFVVDSVSADNVQHRWRKGDALIDVLVPEGMGARADLQKSASGFPTIPTPGGTQALHRAEVVEVQVGDRTGRIARPNLIGALILKAAAHEETASGGGHDRHAYDFATLIAMVAASDLRGADLKPADRRRLRAMISSVRAAPGSLDSMPGSGQRLDRLERHLDGEQWS